MGRTNRILTALLIACLPAVVGAQTASFSPGTEWRSDNDGERCRVSRVFGEGDGRHVLVLEQFYPDDQVNMILAGPALEDFDGGSRARLGLAASAPRKWVMPRRALLPEFGPGIVVPGVRLIPAQGQLRKTPGTAQPALPQVQSPLAQPVEFVTLAQRGEKVHFQTGDLDAQLAALDACTQGLLASWGLDVAKLRDAEHPPQWINRSTVRRSISNAFMEHWKNGLHAQGIAHLRVIVDKTGRPEDCTVIYAAAEMEPNHRACGLMQEARFEPARDAQGEPIRSFYTATFTDYRTGWNDGRLPLGGLGVD